MVNAKSWKAKTKADQIVRRYKLTAPVKVFELGNKIGFNWDVLPFKELKEKIDKVGDKEDKKQIKEVEISELLGFYLKKDKTFYLNSDVKSVNRMKFTLAHEIGHLKLHENLSTNHFRIVVESDIKTNQKEEEVEANYFAGYLLMPDEEIENRLIYAKNIKSEEELYELFAEIFAVNKSVVEYRLKTFKFENPYIWKEYNMDKYVA